SAASLTSRGQAPRSKTERTVKMTDRPRSTETKAETNSSPAFNTAASQNVALRNELIWTFGGKQQTGWHLYDLLIGKTVNADHDPLSNNFAASLSKWQKKSGLGSSGVLDENTL